tara:strand:+ start:116 stop:331 length:216 start_codon:yes stop_codon:yes gene_type:complete
MEKQSIKFTIRQDGTVAEEVMGVVGNECHRITKSIEDQLGSVNYVEHKPDYYLHQKIENVTFQHDKNEVKE